MTKTDLDVMKRRLVRERSPGGRISKALKRELLAVVERARSEGETYRGIAQALGLSWHTLNGWRQRSKRSGAQLAPVQVAAAASSSRDSACLVRGPRGLEVEGLTVAELAELWVRLS